ncbi:hypothetical protein [Pengzhenrongella sicca]|uniref:Uncharacterized protein n=1 Tax=Pengzhenrongella sicca TaxID=2819238 RepID=A0A8A4ZBM4_9MICO|nr:hypothetical protein [Pengzhenrongella sicca]QTE29312.1 hypothetical protein J4E96_18890 [Pengzhenrongella sicca]
MTAPTHARPLAQQLARQDEPADPAELPTGAGFVLYVGVDASFGHGPQALAALVEAAETLQELARDLLPQADTHTTLALTPPAAG